MADDDYSGEGGGRGGTYLLLFVLVFVIVVLLLGGWYVNHNKIDHLTKSLQQTQAEMQKTQKEAAQNKMEAKKEVLQGLDNPATRLALIKAYAASINPLLSSTRQKDLQAIVVYLDGNPQVLITKNPDLPKEIVQDIANVKLAVKNLQVKAAVTTDVSSSTYAFGQTVTLTGTIAYVGEDEELGGSIFTLTDATGNVYYLHFNDTNSTNIKNNMLGKEVKLTVKVTSKANDPLTFQVVSGPTLAPVTQTTTPTVTETLSPTP